MIRLVFFACLVALTAASFGISILKDERTHNPNGEYSFDFESSYGIKRNEVGKQNNGQESSGGWSYTAPDGQIISVTFTAGPQGYVPVVEYLLNPEI